MRHRAAILPGPANAGDTDFLALEVVADFLLFFRFGRRLTDLVRTLWARIAMVAASLNRGDSAEPHSEECGETGGEKLPALHDNAPY